MVDLEDPFDPQPPRAVWRERRYPGEIGNLSAARKFVAEGVDESGRIDLRDDAVLLTSELVGNVLRHAPGEFNVLVWTVGDRVRLEVSDHWPAAVPLQVETEDDASSGRGMFLVDALGAAWGVTATNDTKTVWVELA